VNDEPSGGGKPMKKMSIRKAGTIRLTAATLYCCGGSLR
jgi:hypothetical protein